MGRAEARAGVGVEEGTRGGVWDRAWNWGRDRDCLVQRVLEGAGVDSDRVGLELGQGRQQEK